jgi:hypothetical protein
MADELSIDDQVAAVWWYQQPSLFRHPLTCQIKSDHAWLVPTIINGQVQLLCETCGHIQSWIPDEIFGLYQNREQWDTEEETFRHQCGLP